MSKQVNKLRQKVDLGSIERVIAREGSLDENYQIRIVRQQKEIFGEDMSQMLRVSIGDPDMPTLKYIS